MSLFKHAKTSGNSIMQRWMRMLGTVCLVVFGTSAVLCGADQVPSRPSDDSPLPVKAAYLYQNMLEKHWLEGLYVSITPTAPDGVKLHLNVETSGNVIHAGVWTGRYLGGVAYWFAVTQDPAVRQHADEVLHGLKVLRAVTGKPGLLARGYTKGHGPVVGWERGGNDSVEWHQGHGDYADYRWYGDVSVDNLNAVLYGYALYYDLAADDRQKQQIAGEVDELMTHLLDNHCRIIDVDGEPTQWGHVGIDPDPQFDEYYKELYNRRSGGPDISQFPLRSQLMLLPDLLIAHRITGKPHYLEFYRKVVARHRGNPEPEFYNRPITLERLARFDHSPEGQSYEALYNLIRYERDPELLKIYRGWVTRLWENNWTEGNSLFAFMTLAMLPEFKQPGRGAASIADVPHGDEGLKLGLKTLALYPLDRVFRPVMGSLRPGVELNPHVQQGPAQSTKPVPIHLRPHDNEYEWKGNPYQLDGYLKPHVTSMAFSADDPQVAWFTDSHGRGWMTLDRGETWINISATLPGGGGLTSIVASNTRTFVIWGQAGTETMISRDGGLSWRPAPADGRPEFPPAKFDEWTPSGSSLSVKIDGESRLLSSTDGGKTSSVAMEGWRIPLAKSVLVTPWGIVAGGPGGTYVSSDGKNWSELKLWAEEETGGADFLHAYWMGRFYGFVRE